MDLQEFRNLNNQAPFQQLLLPVHPVLECVTCFAVSMYAMSLPHVETYSWRTDGLFHVYPQKTNQ